MIAAVKAAVPTVGTLGKKIKWIVNIQIHPMNKTVVMVITTVMCDKKEYIGGQ